MSDTNPTDQSRASRWWNPSDFGGATIKEAAEIVGCSMMDARRAQRDAEIKMLLSAIAHPDLYHAMIDADVNLADVACPALVEYLATRLPRKTP